MNMKPCAPKPGYWNPITSGHASQTGYSELSPTEEPLLDGVMQLGTPKNEATPPERGRDSLW